MKRKTRTVSLAEMKLRSDFRETLDLSKYPVKELRIISTYAERELVPCGMPGHHPHKRGCFVATPDHFVTNIGHMCASTHLGEEWTIIERRFSARESDRETFDCVEEFLTRSTIHLERVNRLWGGERGGVWLAKCQSMLDQLPPRVLTRLRNMIRSNDGDILVYEKFRDDGDDDGKEFARLGYQRNSEGVHKLIGTVRALDGANKILLFAVEGNLVNPLRRYAKFGSAHELKQAERRACARFGGSFEQEFARADRMVREGRKFFTEANFAEIAKLADSAGSRADIRHLWKQIEKIRTNNGASAEEHTPAVA